MVEAHSWLHEWEHSEQSSNLTKYDYKFKFGLDLENQSKKQPGTNLETYSSTILCTYKVEMHLRCLHFSPSPLLLGYKTRDQVQNGYQIQIEAVATLPITFEHHMNIMIR